jgi:hypothetical protein
MIYLIDFNGQPRGLYIRTKLKSTVAAPIPGTIQEGQIYTTAPDLEEYANLAGSMDETNYFKITVKDVMTGKTSADAMRKIKHLVLINGWILSALLKRVHITHFELSFGGGERLWVSSFHMGEPLED